jgi:hypothetical protein
MHCDELRALEPIRSPVRDAICSVAATMSAAMGTMATQALKKIHACDCGAKRSSAAVMGTKISGQFIFMQICTDDILPPRSEARSLGLRDYRSADRQSHRCIHTSPIQFRRR